MLDEPRRATVVVIGAIGASRVDQLEENVAALDYLDFTGEELAEIDRFAVDAGVDLSAEAGSGGPLPSAPV
jgi:L-glyceraldehyde 3-phosphate reductase